MSGLRLLGCVRRGECGNIAPLAVVSALVLFAVLAFSVDQGIACMAKVQQENALDAARSACMDASFALAAKGEERPGALVAQQVVDTLRSEGYGGGVSVWFYEVPSGEVPDWRRIWGIAVQMQEEIPTVFARGFGIDSLPVASKRIVMAEPYADTVTWRPRNSGVGRYEVTAGADASLCTYVPLLKLEDFPVELAHETRAQIAEAKRGTF